MRKGLAAFTIIGALIILAATIAIVLPYANEPKSLVGKQSGEKTLIIFAEAMPYLRTTENMDNLPNIKALCDDGTCLSMKPAAPTFTTMEEYVLKSGNDPADAQFQYNYIINYSDWANGKCSFVGELMNLGKSGDYNLFNAITGKLKFTYYSIMRDDEERYAEDIFPQVLGMLQAYDVLAVHITDTDAHHTNLTTPGQYTQKLIAFDTEIGRLMNALKRTGLYNKTNIILYGDHGMAAIQHFEYLDTLDEELGQKINMSQVCFWNDAGTSLRFWVLPGADKSEIAKAINGFFPAKSECFYPVNDDVLASHSMLTKDKELKWLTFGDAYIAVKPYCKLNTRKPTGGMEGFSEQQNKVDSYISMHAYIDNKYPELQAFMAAKLVKPRAMPSNFTIKDLHNLIKNVFEEQ